MRVLQTVRAQLADQLLALRSGTLTPAQFATLTSPAAMAANLATTQLPGKLAAQGALLQPLPSHAETTAVFTALNISSEAAVFCPGDRPFAALP